MNGKLKIAGLIMILTAAALFAGGSQEADSLSSASESGEATGLGAVAAELGITEQELQTALGDPSQGPPDFEKAAGKLGVSTQRLEDLMKRVMDEDESVEIAPYTISLNGIAFKIAYEVFDWETLPPDVVIERQTPTAFISAEGRKHYYEAVHVSSGNLNWYQAAALAEDAGGYLACPETEEENAFIFSLVDDKKFFWSFPEEGNHYGISIGPFLGGYQPEGSAEPDGGWRWLSGEAWEYTNWAQNLDDGVIDRDPRPNDQPNNSGGDQPIMGFGEMNLPVPTWGDYFDSVGTYGLRKSPGKSYGFVIEYESDPR